jgi:hypothetical protein
MVDTLEEELQFVLSGGVNWAEFVQRHDSVYAFIQRHERIFDFTYEQGKVIVRLQDKVYQKSKRFRKTGREKAIMHVVETMLNFSKVEGGQNWVPVEVIEHLLRTEKMNLVEEIELHYWKTIYFLEAYPHLMTGSKDGKLIKLNDHKQSLQEGLVKTLQNLTVEATPPRINFNVPEVSFQLLCPKCESPVTAKQACCESPCPCMIVRCQESDRSAPGLVHPTKVVADAIHDLAHCMSEGYKSLTMDGSAISQPSVYFSKVWSLLQKSSRDYLKRHRVFCIKTLLDFIGCPTAQGGIVALMGDGFQETVSKLLREFLYPEVLYPGIIYVKFSPCCQSVVNVFSFHR